MALTTPRDEISTFLPEPPLEIKGKTRTSFLLFHGTGKKKKLKEVYLDVVLSVGNPQSSALVRFDYFIIGFKSTPSRFSICLVRTEWIVFLLCYFHFLLRNTNHQNLHHIQIQEGIFIITVLCFLHS